MLSILKAKIDSIFDTDRFDLLNWREATNILPHALEEDKETSKTLGGHPVQDGFFSLYKANPRLLSPPPLGLETLSEIFRRGMDTPNWQRLKDACVGDIVASVVGGVAFIKEVIASLPEEVEGKIREAVNATSEINDLKDNIEALKSLLDALKENNLPTEDIEKTIKEKKNVLLQQEELAQKTLSELENTLSEKESKIADILNKSAEKALKSAEEITGFVEGFSLASGSPTTSNPYVARKAMEVLKQNPNLRDLAKMLGWARRMVKGEWRKSPHSRTEFVGYRVHELQLDSIAPSELVHFLSGNETLELDFIRRVGNGEVLHRHYKGKEKKGRGPLIIVRDESGSMEGAKHSLSVALEWALLEIAQKDKRDFYSIPFSGEGQFHVWKAPTLPDPDSVVAHLSHFYGHGTEPYSPLLKALEILEKGDLRADILLLTDEKFGTPPSDFLNKLKEVRNRRPLRIVVVIIGTQTHRSKEFADRVIPVRDLIKEKEKLRKAVREVV